MFEAWDNFYLLVGGGSGALIGLMFIVAPLTVQHDPNLVARGTKVYLTPIVFHFATVMGLSVVSAIPGLTRPVLGALLALAAAAGLVYAIITTKRLFADDWKDPVPDTDDKWWYGILPMIVYLALGAVAASVWLAPADSLYAMAVTLLVILLMGIRNAWDLVTALAMRRS